jgi:hypothetical protein
MNFFFKKKPDKPAMAELLENGRELANQEMMKPKYRDYQGAEPMIEVAVRVYPANEVPFEAKMKAGISKSILLLPGVRVQVKYDEKKTSVVLDDDHQAILARNPQLIKK